MDWNIIRLPWILRQLLSELIAYLRSKREAGEAYGEMGGSSPLLENTKAQSRALHEALSAAHPDIEFRHHVAMRYWHPFAQSVAAEVQAFQPDQVLLIPMYPQFSTTTTRSALQDWFEAARAIGLEVDTRTLCCHPWMEGYIEASAANVKAAYEEALKASATPPRVLFSAHGLPKSIIKDGDSYDWQCKETARRIAEATSIPDLDWAVCYQSKVGPQKWLEPSTEDEIERAAETKTPLLIYPHAFVCEHVETIVELGIEYREIAEEMEIPYYEPVQTVGINPLYINGLKEQVERLLQDNPNVTRNHTAKGKSLCPCKFKRCAQREVQKYRACVAPARC